MTTSQHNRNAIHRYRFSIASVPAFERQMEQAQVCCDLDESHYTDTSRLTLEYTPTTSCQLIMCKTRLYRLFLFVQTSLPWLM